MYGQGPSIVGVHGTDMELSKESDPVMVLLMLRVLVTFNAVRQIVLIQVHAWIN